MKIKTLSEVKSQFPSLHESEQMSIIGGLTIYSQANGSGTSSYIDDNLVSQGWNFVLNEDQDAGTFTHRAPDGTITTDIAGEGGSSRFSLYGYDERGNPVYMDTQTYGFLHFYDHTYAASEYVSTTDSYGVADGDYLNITNTLSRTFYDQVLDAYYTVDHGTSTDRVYTGYDSYIQAQIAAEAAAAEIRRAKATTWDSALNSALVTEMATYQYTVAFKEFYDNPENVGKIFHGPNSYKGSKLFKGLRDISQQMQTNMDAEALIEKTRNSNLAILKMVQSAWDASGGNIELMKCYLYGDVEFQY